VRFRSCSTGRSDKCVAWLDVSNAFGAIPHEAIDNYGAGDGLLQIVHDIYNGATSSVSVAAGRTPDTQFNREFAKGAH